MDCQFKNSFSFRMVIYYFRNMPKAGIYKARKPRMSKLGHTILCNLVLVSGIERQKLKALLRRRVEA